MIDAGLSPEQLLAVQRAAFLAGPTVAGAVLLLICRPQPREAVGAMVAFLWQLPALLALHLLALHFGWWSFGGSRNMLIGLPIDVWIGWAIWWGPVAVFLNRWLSLPTIVATSVAIDAVSMPILSPLVTVGPTGSLAMRWRWRSAWLPASGWRGSREPISTRSAGRCSMCWAGAATSRW